MSTIWTPSGEYAPKPEPEPAAPPAGPAAGPAGDRAQPAQPTPEQVEAMRQQVLAVLAVPVVDQIAEHLSGLMELAALHLDGAEAFGGTAKPDLVEASLAIDAVGALVEALGPRLGGYQPQVVRALAELRLAYVEAAGLPAGR